MAGVLKGAFMSLGDLNAPFRTSWVSSTRLSGQRALPRNLVSISGYWRTGHNEDRWQATKREWNRKVEEEQD